MCIRDSINTLRYALVELESDELAQLAVEKLQEIVIQDQKPVVMYAIRTSPHQFESKCNTSECGGAACMHKCVAELWTTVSSCMCMYIILSLSLSLSLSHTHTHTHTHTHSQSWWFDECWQWQ